MSDPLPQGAVVGILGGGQLGRMLALAAARLGLRCHVYDPAPDGPVALLVWGDPSLYDSALRVAARLSPAPEVSVIPGITSLQALTAAFAMPLNDINAPVLITTGRQLRDHGWPGDARRVAVMLDGECSFTGLDPEGIEIWWGAFLSLPNQILRHGPLADVGNEIVELRAEARAAHGWIMDTYLLANGQ